MVPPEEMYLKVLHEVEPVASCLHLDVSDQIFANPDEAALHFGLKPLGSNWRAVDRATASSVLSNLLCEDMAYDQPRLSKHEIAMSMDEFLTHFGASARFFTNAEWENRGLWSRQIVTSWELQWHPATAATYDGGVLVLDEGKSGVLWLEDED